MSISFVPKSEFLPADNDTLRRRLQSVLGVETGPASDTEGLGETCGYRHPVDLQSGVRLTAARCYRQGITSPPPNKALAVIQIIAAIAEDAPLHRALFARKQRISLRDLEHLMNAAVRTGLWKLAEYTGRLPPAACRLPPAPCPLTTGDRTGCTTTSTSRSGIVTSPAICGAKHSPSGECSVGLHK